MTSPPSHSMVFWLGDMNYRIQTSLEMTVEMIKAHADNFQISSLLREDQLVQEMTKGTIFSDFAEGAIDFKPTYKYDPNTDNWDSRSVGGLYMEYDMRWVWFSVRSTAHLPGVTGSCITEWEWNSAPTALTRR